ncbi:MAG TPA: hypothetical protein VJR89_17685 [Polyangiales bacterium]|nr:hypothetical protein [Polyangiales bacterium]
MEFIREAGVSVYPVLVAGVVSLAWAARYARARAPDDLSKLMLLAALTLVLGALGTATGLQASVRTIASVPEKWMFLIGLREALNNLVLALAFVSLDLIVLAFVPAGPKAPQDALGPAQSVHASR